MKRTVLVVDDHETNRKLLEKMLSGSYQVLQAADGLEALAQLRRGPEKISAVLLDLIMPEMDGYQVLAEMQADARLAPIPVIVVTGDTAAGAEKRALALGAREFITKPYNPDTILHRLGNTIHLRETAASYYASRWDELTGLYSRQAFFERAQELIGAEPAGTYTLSCFDIDNFKVINDQYGTARGDEVLRGVADIFRTALEPVGGICCRIMADNFALLYPHGRLELEKHEALLRRVAALGGTTQPLGFSIGRYVVDDRSLPISAMYDRAKLAEESVKGRYDVRTAVYDESMRDALLREQRIVTEMNDALKNGQFELWFQPQYNHETGHLIGAEALVRWNHPRDGLLIAPGEFIPVFERNGFIYELDKYVWEQACILLRKWLDAGEDPLPLSVNVSRYDVFREDFFRVLTGLVERYQLPAELLRIEITESAFAQSTEQIVHVVRELIDFGFIVEIDDFGSGYSSLNTLKDVPASVLKMDMRFLEISDNLQRGGSIIESVVRMAKWLGMSVIAEGVETRAQADYLKSIGCSYIQGYFYAQPMPAGDYEALLARADKETRTPQLETAETFNNNSFWDPESLDSLIFNNYVGAACIFEYRRGRTELLRVNDKYMEVIGCGRLTVEEALRLQWESYLDAGDREKFHAALEEAVATDRETSCEVALRGTPCSAEPIYLRTHMRMVAAAGDCWLIYSMNKNITEQRLAEQKSAQTAQRLQIIAENAANGVTIAIVRDNGQVEFQYANDRFYQLLGYTREQYEREVGDAFGRIHPEDRAWVIKKAAEANSRTDKVTMEFRIIRRSGREVWLRDVISRLCFEDTPEPVQMSIFTDITDEVRLAGELEAAENQLRENDERARALLNLVVAHSARVIYRYDVDARRAEAIVRDGSRSVGLPAVIEDMPESLISAGVIFPEDAAYVRSLFTPAGAGERRNRIRLRVRGEDAVVRWLDVRASQVGSDSRLAILSFQDITEAHEREMAYARYRQSTDAARRGSTLFFETDLTADQVEKQGGALLPETMPPAGSSHTETVAYLLANHVAPENREAAEQILPRAQLLTAYADGQRELKCELCTHTIDGECLWVQGTLQMVADPYTGHIKLFALFRDISQEKQSDLAIRRQAEMDGMTGLLNRATIERAIREELSRGKRGRSVLVLLDLDELKTINDLLGHAQGDAAIRKVAEILRGSFRKSDLVGRAGGDELIVFLRDAPNEARLRTMLSGLIRRISEHSVGENGERRLHCSVGAAFAPAQGCSFEELFRQADTALYHVKRNGKNDYAFYTPDMQLTDYKYTGHGTLSLRRDELFERRELQHVLGALSAFYPMVISLNLSQNSYYLMEYQDEHLEFLPESGCMDTMIAHTLMAIHPEDRDYFDRHFSRRALLQAYSQGVTKLRGTYRQMERGGYSRVVINVVLYADDGGELCEFAFIRRENEGESTLPAAEGETT